MPRGVPHRRRRPHAEPSPLYTGVRKMPSPSPTPSPQLASNPWPVWPEGLQRNYTIAQANHNEVELRVDTDLDAFSIKQNEVEVWVDRNRIGALMFALAEIEHRP